MEGNVAVASDEAMRRMALMGVFARQNRQLHKLEEMKVDNCCIGTFGGGKR